MFEFKVQFVQRGKYSTFVVKSSNLMLYWAKVAVCSKVQTRYINVLCGESFWMGNLVVHCVSNLWCFEKLNLHYTTVKNVKVQSSQQRAKFALIIEGGGVTRKAEILYTWSNSCFSFVRFLSKRRKFFLHRKDCCVTNIKTNQIYII
jgi:hypothetical protein